MAKVSTIYDVRIKYHLDTKSATRGLGAFNKKVKAVSKSVTSMNKKTKATSRDMTRLGRAGGRSMRTIDRQARRAAASLNKVSRNASKANRSASGGRGKKSGGGIRRVVGAAAGFFGAKAILKHTIGYNRELDTTKKSLGTVIQLMDKDTKTRSAGLSKAGILMGQLREDAKNSAGTFQDMTGFAKQIAPPLLAAGASMEQLRELTKGGVVASSAFGIDADVAALDIRQAMGKGLNKRDPFGSMLLDSIGMTTDAFNELDKVSRMKTLQKAFNQPAIKAAAAEYQNSFEGVFSTFKSTLQEFGGKVGSKLFKTLTVELKKVNTWFTENSEAVDDLATSFADGMVTAFEMAKGVFGFIIEHKDLLMTLAKAFLITKGVGAMTGPFAALGSASVGMAAKLGTVTAGLGMLYVGLQGYADHIDRKQDATIDAKTDNAGLKEDMMLLGGGKQRAGIYEVNEQSARTDQRRGKQYGLADDIGVSISEKMGDTKQERLAKGRFTAGEKFNAAKQGEEAKKFMTGKKVNLGFVKKSFGVGDDGNAHYGATKMGGSRGVLGEAQRLAGGGGAFNQLTPGDMAAKLQEANKIAGDGEVRRMATFLTGLQRTLDISSRSSAELLNATIMREFQNGDFHRAEEIGASIKAGAMTQVNAIGSMLENLGLVSKASDDDKKKDKKNNVNIGKIVMQVESNDPDRLAMGMEGLFSDLAKNGSQAANALREG